MEYKREYIRGVLDSVGLSDWSLWTNDSYSVIGKVQFERKRIVFSKRYVAIASKEELRRATLHEAAHAILETIEHDKEFVELCSRLSPDKPYDKYCISAPIHKYNMICPVCGDTGETNKNTPIFCELCPGEGRGVNEYIKTDNKLDVKEWASTP